MVNSWRAGVGKILRNRETSSHPHGIWGDARGDLYVGELSVDQLRGDIPAGYPLVHKLVRIK